MERPLFPKKARPPTPLYGACQKVVGGNAE